MAAYYCGDDSMRCGWCRHVQTKRSHLKKYKKGSYCAKCRKFLMESDREEKRETERRTFGSTSLVTAATFSSFLMQNKIKYQFMFKKDIRSAQNMYMFVVAKSKKKEAEELMIRASRISDAGEYRS